MEKQIILFDIDKTLFNIDQFFNDFLIPNLENDGLMDKNEFELVSAEYRKRRADQEHFSPEGWVQVAEQKLEKNMDAVRDYFYNPDFFTASVYPEVIPVLNELKDDYHLGIYSEGDFNWQNKKIDLSGIKYNFEQKYIIISDEKVSEKTTDLIPHKAIIIDDRKDVVLALQKLEDVFPIWLNRKQEETLPNTFVIPDLTQLLAMVERIIRENLQ